MSQLYQLREELLRPRTERQIDPLSSSKEVSYAREVGADYVGEQQGWSTTGENAPVDLGNLQLCIHRCVNDDKVSFSSQEIEEFP